MDNRFEIPDYFSREFSRLMSGEAGYSVTAVDRLYNVHPKR